MSASTLQRTLAVGALVALVATTVMAEVNPPPRLDNPLDRDGDGRIGEDETIRARVRNYHQRHGDNDLVTSEALLAKTRWAYHRYLDKQRRGRLKGIEGTGWVNIGPNNGAGRASCVAPHPADVGTVLAGAAGGGVWKTTDGGQTWRSLTDGLVSDLSVGAIAYAPANPDVVYLGTGEGGDALDFIPGIGLVRSLDGGESWILPDYAIAPEFFAISVDPRDTEGLSILVGTSAGLFASEDGGVTWTFPLIASGTEVTEVVRSSSNADLVYAALWCKNGCPDGYARVMRSTDAGATWTAAGTGLPAASTQGYNVNRNSLWVAASDDQVLYLGLNTAPTDDDDPPAWIYRSTNGGDSWVATTKPDDYLGQQGWYDNTITISPTDPDVVFAGGVFYVVSRNGGQSWTTKNPYSSGGGMGTATLPHVDGHDLQWQGDTLWLACDGGIWSSTDDGATWTGHNLGLITRQYYGLAIDPINRERVLGGTQDNGTDRRRDQGDDSWDDVLGADGFDCAINPLVPQYTHASIQFGRVYLSITGGTTDSFREVTPYYTDDEDTPFITLITTRPDAPWVMYTGSTRVYRSDDAGLTWVPLPRTVSGGSWNQSNVWAIAVTRADPEVLMVAKGTDVYASDDGGQTWRSSSGHGLPGSRVNNVEISPFDADVAVACQAGTGVRRFYRTDDGGQTWVQSDEGLPPFAVQVARWDPTDPDVVYAGTDVGIYRSVDGGLSWSEFGDGFPAASVHDIRILPDGSMLRVATHGRGVWELTIPQGDNNPPEITITQAGADQVDNGGTVTYTAAASDPDGDDVTVTWVFADLWQTRDGGTASGSLTSTVDYLFEVGGFYLVTAHVTDSHGATASASRWIIVNETADSCATPRVVPGGGPFPHTVITDNAYASRASSDPILPAGCSSGGTDGTNGSLWFELTPARSARYVIDACGSFADTVLSVWTGEACGPYTPLVDGCNDDDEQVHCPGRRTDSYLELDLEAGQTYRILVGAWRPDYQGKITFTVDCPDCPPLSRPVRRPSGRIPRP